MVAIIGNVVEEELDAREDSEEKQGVSNLAKRSVTCVEEKVDGGRTGVRREGASANACLEAATTDEEDEAWLRKGENNIKTHK